MKVFMRRMYRYIYVNLKLCVHICIVIGCLFVSFLVENDK